MERLLIVDDSKLMRNMVAACLRPFGEIVFELAETGLEAIERLALTLDAASAGKYGSQAR